MKIHDKKTTILKASKERAEQISAGLLNTKTPAGATVFERAEIENGFEIRGYRIINKKKTPAIIFRYINDQGRKWFEYDSYAITID